jgi:hypothetical protein
LFPPDSVVLEPDETGSSLPGLSSPHSTFSRLAAAAGKPVFMRVRENPPPFTLRLLKSFVNSKSPVSTGFLRFSQVF